MSFRRGCVLAVCLTGILLTSCIDATSEQSIQQTPSETPVSALALGPTVSTTPAPVTAPFPCKILPDDLCSLGQLIKVTQDDGSSSYGVGFIVPIGTLVRSPMAGLAVKAVSTDGVLVTIQVDACSSETRVHLTGALSSSLTPSSGLAWAEVPDGGPLGYLASDSRLFGVNLFVTVARTSSDGSIDQAASREMLRSMFPYLSDDLAQDVRPERRVFVLPPRYGSEPPSNIVRKCAPQR